VVRPQTLALEPAGTSLPQQAESVVSAPAASAPGQPAESPLGAQARAQHARRDNPRAGNSRSGNPRRGNELPRAARRERLARAATAASESTGATLARPASPKETPSESSVDPDLAALFALEPDRQRPEPARSAPTETENELRGLFQGAGGARSEGKNAAPILD
jgi:hypothetical protein